MMTFIIPAAVFIGVAAFVGAVALVFRNPSTTAVEERLDMLTGVGGGRESHVESSVLAHPLDDVPGLMEEFFSRFLNLRKFLQQADLPLTPTKFIVISLVMGGVGGFLVFILGKSLVLVPLMALSLGVLPLAFAYLKRNRRKSVFAKQLPEALELVARALRAGHSLGSGFQLVAGEMPDPISTEFRRVFEEQNLGVALEQALESMCDRVPNVDLRFFATAVILQRQTGGDLAEILDKIGHLIRERFRIWGQIQALTGEGRLSGIVLMALPPALFLVMYKLNRDYVMMLFTHPMGKQMLLFAIILQVLGALVIKKIVNIKV